MTQKLKGLADYPAQCKQFVGVARDCEVAAKMAKAVKAGFGRFLPDITAPELGTRAEALHAEMLKFFSGKLGEICDLAAKTLQSRLQPCEAAAATATLTSFREEVSKGDYTHGRSKSLFSVVAGNDGKDFYTHFKELKKWRTPTSDILDVLSDIRTASDITGLDLPAPSWS